VWLRRSKRRQHGNEQHRCHSHKMIIGVGRVVG
jgi:hypothetical protein